MLSFTISESKKFGNLRDNTSRLTYLMLLPWVDREGRYEADATLISHRVLMRCGIPEEQVEIALNDLHRCGLIHLYSVQGKRVLEFVDFLKWNKPHWKEPDSMLPARPNASHTQESNVNPSTSQEQPKVTPTLRQAPTAEGKGREVKEREEEGKTTPPTPPRAAEVEPDKTEDDEADRSITLANRRRANRHATALLTQQHPEVKHALDDLQSIYNWKPAQHGIFAERLLELARDNGSTRTAAAINHMLGSGATIGNPLAYVKKLLTTDNTAPLPPGSTIDLDAIFGPVN